MSRSQLGLGVMIQMLGGNADTVAAKIAAIKACMAKKIKTVELKDDQLVLTMADGLTLRLWDNGQSCCESRYMTCDDDLTNYTNTILKDIQLADAPERESRGECHEVMFLKILTGKGTITCETHNEHNGYYGGFSVTASVS
jgi:hypothetical protein